MKDRNKHNKHKIKVSTKSILIKILICVVATAFTVIAAMLDNPWLCVPALAALAVGVIFDE